MDVRPPHEIGPDDHTAGDPPAPSEATPPPVAWAPAPQPLTELPVSWRSPDAAQPVVAYRSAHARSIIVAVLLVATAVVNLLKIIHYATFEDLVRAVRAGVAGVAEGAAFDSVSTTLIGAYGVSVLICALAYMAWLSRGVDNAPALGAGTPLRSPRGAIGWWFAPFANFVVPYLIVRDLHDRLAVGLDRGSNRALLLGWWLLWNGTNIVGAVLGRLGVARSIDDIRATVLREQVQAGLLIVAAILAILVVRRIQAREDSRARALLDGSAGEESLALPAPA